MEAEAEMKAEMEAEMKAKEKAEMKAEMEAKAEAEMEVKNLVFSSGGLKAYTFLGILKNFNLEHVEAVSGCSAGAIMGFLFCFKNSMENILEFVSDETNTIINKEDLLIRNLMIKFGINDGMRMERVLEKYCEKLTNKKRITFKELKVQFGIDFYVAVTNLTKHKHVIHSHHEFPDMDVITSIHMSMTVPLYFSPVKYEGDYYVDGAFFVPDPFEPIVKYHKPTPENTLMMRAVDANVTKIESMLDYVVTLATMIRLSLVRQTKSEHLMTCIDVDTTDLPFISHSFDRETMIRCIERGNSTYLYFKGTFSR